MERNFIDFEADSLELAREKNQKHITDDLRLISERVLCDGKPTTTKPQISTSEELAFEEARKRLSEDVEILEEIVLRSALQEVIIVEGFEEREAKHEANTQARKQFGGPIKTNICKLIKAGRKGVAGIGKQPNQYEVEIFRNAEVEIKYKPKAKIRAEIGKAFTPDEILANSLKSEDPDICEEAIEKLLTMDTELLNSNGELFMMPLLYAGWSQGKNMVNKEFSDKVIKVLEIMGEPAIELLLKLSEDYYLKATYACIALVKLGHPIHAPKARAKLGTLVEGGDEYAAYHAIAAMTVIGDQEIVNYLKLVALQTNPNELVRAKVAHALGVIGDNSAVPELTEAANNDPSWQNVRPVAEAALKKFQ